MFGFNYNLYPLVFIIFTNIRNFAYISPHNFYYVFTILEIITNYYNLEKTTFYSNLWIIHNFYSKQMLL